MPITQERIASVIAYFSMCGVSLMINVRLLKKVFFMIGTLLLFACGIAGLAHEVIPNNLNMRRLNMLNFLEQIFVLNLITIEICRTKGVPYVIASVLLLPTILDLVAAFWTRREIHWVTQFTKFISVLVMTFLSYYHRDGFLFLTSVVYLWTVVHRQSQAEYRMMKSAAHVMAIQYLNLSLLETTSE